MCLIISIWTIFWGKCRKSKLMTWQGKPTGCVQGCTDFWIRHSWSWWELNDPRCWAVLSCSAVADTAILWTAAARLLCPWGCSRQEYCHAVFQGGLPNPWSKPGLSHCRWILYRVSTRKAWMTHEVWLFLEDSVKEKIAQGHSTANSPWLSKMRGQLLPWVLGTSAWTERIW